MTLRHILGGIKRRAMRALEVAARSLCKAARWAAGGIATVFDRRMRVWCVNCGDIRMAEWFKPFLREEKRNYRMTSFRPHICYFSVFGKREAIRKTSARIKVFCSGEDTQKRYTDYKDHCYGEVDLAMDFQLALGIPSAQRERERERENAVKRNM